MASTRCDGAAAAGSLQSKKSRNLDALFCLASGDLRCQQGPVVVKTTHGGPGAHVLGDPLGHDVARPLQGVIRRSHARFRRDESPSRFGGFETIGRILGEQTRGQRLQAPLAGDGGPGASLGAEGKVDVFQGGQGGSRGQLSSQLLGEERAFVQGPNDRVAPLLEVGEACQAVSHRRDLHFVEGVRRFLAVAGDERDRGSRGEKGRPRQPPAPGARRVPSATTVVGSRFESAVVLGSAFGAASAAVVVMPRRHREAGSASPDISCEAGVWPRPRR